MRLTLRTALLAASLGLCSTAASAQTVLTLTSWEPPNHPYVTHALKPWAEMVDKATEGRVKINILAKPVAAPGATFDAVRNGLADIGYSVHGYSPGRFVLTRAVELPFMGSNAEAMSVAYWRIHEKYLAKSDEHAGVKLLGVFVHGPGAIHASRPVNTVADLKGMKLRVGGGTVADVATKLGAVGLLKPAPEAYMLLQNGVADGVMFPMEAIKSFNLTKLVPNTTQVPGGLFNTSWFFVMNEQKFQSLSKQDQDALLSVSGEALAKLHGQSWDWADEQGIAAAKEAGNKVVVAGDAFVKEVRELTASVEADWVAAAKAKGIDGAAVLAEFRQEVDKLAPR